MSPDLVHLLSCCLAVPYGKIIQAYFASQEEMKEQNYKETTREETFEENAKPQ
jgi:hypothetical protein